jgi:hypothetical protein
MGAVERADPLQPGLGPRLQVGVGVAGAHEVAVSSSTRTPALSRDGTPWDSEIDRALEVVVSEINSLAERQDGGPGVVLTVGGLVIGGTIIPDWQWFEEVEHAARAAFTVHTGGSIDDEHGGWARLLRGVSESLVRDREEHRAAQNVIGGLSESYRRLLVREDRTTYIHLSDARVLASGVSPCHPAGCTGRAWRKVVLPGQWVLPGHRGRSRGDGLGVDQGRSFRRHLADQQRCRTRQLATAGCTS